jgi:hypothetical protein
MEKYYNKIIYWIKKNYVRVDWFYVSRNVIKDVKEDRVTLKDGYIVDAIKDLPDEVLAVKDKKERK